jgi:hypothetical protein
MTRQISFEVRKMNDGLLKFSVGEPASDTGAAAAT